MCADSNLKRASETLFIHCVSVTVLHLIRGWRAVKCKKLNEQTIFIISLPFGELTLRWLVHYFIFIKSYASGGSEPLAPVAQLTLPAYKQRADI